MPTDTGTRGCDFTSWFLCHLVLVANPQVKYCCSIFLHDGGSGDGVHLSRIRMTLIRLDLSENATVWCHVLIRGEWTEGFVAD